MATATLSDDQLGELLDLIRDADSVELKLTVPESAHYAAAAALGVDPLDAQALLQRPGADVTPRHRVDLDREVVGLAHVGEHAPAGLSLDDLSVLGPILVLKLKFEPEGLERRLAVELWMYPDGSRVLELSTKCAPTEAFMAAAETRTRKALEFFAARAKPA
jgi:hypothetical protein